MRRMAILLALCLLLTGCSFGSGHYSFISPHTGSYGDDARQEVTVDSYLELRSAVCNIVDRCTPTATILLRGDLQETDIRQAIDYVRTQYPMGAYNLRELSWVLGSSGQSRALQLTLEYNYPLSQILRIQTFRRTNDVLSTIYAALENHQDSLTFQLANYTDTDLTQLVQDYARSHCEAVMEVPQVSVTMYPETGSHRLIHLRFTYQTDRSELNKMKTQVQRVFRSAVLYLNPSSHPMTRYHQLYTFLTQRWDYDIATSLTPSYSLLLHGVGDSRAFAMVFSAMCRSVNLPCQVITGTRDGQVHCWNLLYDGTRYYHLDLLTESFAPCSDGEMTGYVWDYSAYPKAEDVPVEIPQETLPETTPTDPS